MATQAEIDQMVAAVRDLFPPVWGALFRGCLEQGFTPDQALELVKTYIRSQSNSG